MTSEIDTLFEAAQANAKLLPARPDNPTLLKIYALYKQATEGDNTGKKPSFSDIVARAKWDAWTALKGTSAEDAKQKYVDLIESLRNA
ncbi:acyl-CoA-binding protein [Xenophilus sp.]|uniref:acyl-CoA-binding protein n=1 Tax=Xenophilus sp. TaxID=1873499 RepID=UPI0037DC0E6D